MSDNKENAKDILTPKKRPYVKPEIESEELLTFGALCNGTANAGRKASTGGPDNCNAKKLTS